MGAMPWFGSLTQSSIPALSLPPALDEANFTQMRPEDYSRRAMLPQPQYLIHYRALCQWRGASHASAMYGSFEKLNIGHYYSRQGGEWSPEFSTAISAAGALF